MHLPMSPSQDRQLKFSRVQSLHELFSAFLLIVLFSPSPLEARIPINELGGINWFQMDSAEGPLNPIHGVIFSESGLLENLGEIEHDNDTPSIKFAHKLIQSMFYRSPSGYTISTSLGSISYYLHPEIIGQLIGMYYRQKELRPRKRISSVATVFWENLMQDPKILGLIQEEHVRFCRLITNGEAIPDGAFIGVFFTNDAGNYSCGGYQTMDNGAGNQAIAAWGTETGLDNGFDIGEEYTVFIQIYGQTFIADNVNWNLTPPFSNAYALNGFGQIVSATFSGEITGIPGCTDSTALNYNPLATVDDGSCIACLLYTSDAADE